MNPSEGSRNEGRKLAKMSFELDFRLGLTDLRKAKIDTVLTLLALQALGVSRSDLAAMFELPDTSLDPLLEEAKEKLYDGRLNQKDTEDTGQRAPEPIGKEKLKSLLNKRGIAYGRKHFDVRWQRQNKAGYVDVDRRRKRVYEPKGTFFRPANDALFLELVDPFVELMFHRELNEVWVFIPIPGKNAKKYNVKTKYRNVMEWDLLSFETQSLDEDAALRVVFFLTMLGFYQQTNGDIPVNMARLVEISQDLAKYIHVYKKPRRSHPQNGKGTHDTETAQFPPNQLLLIASDPPPARLSPKETREKELLPKPTRPIVMKLKPGAFQERQFDSWKYATPVNHSPFMCSRLMELLLNTSGIVCRLPLTPKTAEPALRIYAPELWIQQLKRNDTPKLLGRSPRSVYLPTPSPAFRHFNKIRRRKGDNGKGKSRMET
jgi:hypothetical protein